MNAPALTLSAAALFAAALFTTAAAAPATAKLCPAESAPDAGAIKASARRFSAHAGEGGRLSGEVQIEQNDNRVRAEHVHYDSQTRRLEASGNVRYTNCEGKDPAWFLSADNFTLDRERGAGVAENAWLVVGGVPLLYLPRYRVSLKSGRRSGFLSPDVGDNSETGVTVALPYYLNLAPNHDATVEPRILSKRGVQFAGNYRYLQRFSRGTLKGDWLNDNDYPDDDPDGERYSYTLDHRTRAGDNLRVEALLQRVSDDDYVEDLSGSFDLIGENYLNSAMLADYVWRGWHLNLTAENFQRIDEIEGEAPNLFERQPSVALSKTLYAPKFGLDFDLHAEWANFNRKTAAAGDAGDETPLDAKGERLDGELVVSRPWRRPGFHFTPSVALRHTDYNVEDRPHRARTLPWFSLRTGLVFEKDSPRNRYRRTIEPELFYLNVPRREQNDLPVFDTGLAEFRFSRLFRPNRYNGADRIGDADQLTLALSSRVIHSRSGKEALRLSLGHTSYFRDREVRLPDEDTAANRYDYSDLSSELALNLNEKVKFLASLTWDTQEEHSARHATRLTLDAGGNKIIGLAHHYLRGDEGFSQAEIGFHLPAGERWKWFGAWWHDLRIGEDVGVMAGLRYDSCCWGFSLSGQRLLQDRSVATGSLDYNTMIGIEFSLRGLTKLGVNTDRGLIEKWVPGYRR